ncbi:ZPR1 zinc finger domain-containing protein [Candidatus Woesearchaeota archaeon]|nr:ZPR1 zinc finger domain-containing protein [Candidatus Woesearchaeota archaeon]
MPEQEENKIKEETVNVCPLCRQKTLTLMEREMEVPYFGNVFIFSMTCSNCKYHKSDVESVEQKEPCKYSFEISSQDDMKVRVVKSSEATVKIPHITTITPGPASQGFVTNIEGILSRVKYQIETLRDTAEDDEDRKKAKNLLKKLLDMMWGKEKQKIIIEDPSGNSAIISDKAVKEPLKANKVKVEK